MKLSREPRILSGVGEGWVPIVEGLDASLAELDPKYTLDQVKEKFGGLRFYYTLSFEKDLSHELYDQAEQLVALAERIAMRTCENCGLSGRLRDERWAKTLCDECHSKRKGS